MHLALFDFDGTLTRRDSFMPFLRQLVGTPRFVLGLIACSGTLAAFATGRLANDVAKERVIAHFLQGRRLAELQAAGERFAAGRLERLLRPGTMAALERHRAVGDTCVLVSASLGVYLRPWAAAHGFAAVLCSELGVDVANRATGRIVPRNCHGVEKARRIAAWLDGRAPGAITAYGDSRGDHEMLALADTAHWFGPRAKRPAGCMPQSP